MGDAPILCKICGKRRARRACPAVGGDICTICCGTEREVSLACPLKCQWLKEAHRHEKPVAVADNRVLHLDINVSEEFLRQNEELMVVLMHALLEASRRTEGAIDADAIAALEAMIQTHRTLESGLVYETRAENTVAARLQRTFSESLADYQKSSEQRPGGSPHRNREILAMLVFLYRMGVQSQNGRPRGRMYLDLLQQMVPERSVEERAPSIIL